VGLQKERELEDKLCVFTCVCCEKERALTREANSVAFPLTSNVPSPTEKTKKTHTIL